MDNVCRCAAKSAIDCCCDGVDWRSNREKELEVLCAELKAKVDSLIETLYEIENNSTETNIRSIARLAVLNCNGGAI
jgi:hypothetical protein